MHMPTFLAIRFRSEISSAAWQPSCNFRGRSYPLTEGVVMRFRSCVAVWGLAVLLSGSLAVVPKAPGQDNSTETTKRKVRTRTAPDYRRLSRRRKVTGKVKIEATIAADGHVTTTRVIGGSPVLVSSAVEALKKWRFEPAAKDTTEIIEFDFSGQSN